MKPFIDKLIDWKDFEMFVADLYRHSEELTVEHDVTETGKSGAKRQVDVMVVQKTKLHSIKTIIECKRWKKKVDRQVIDVLFASVEDLNANKGAIFTTKGYEAGAAEYAKSKNIDIFLVRDIYADEWGKPGRHVQFYIQYFNGLVDNFSFGNQKFMTTSKLPLSNNSLNFDIIFSQNQEFPPHLDLFSEMGLKQGPNFVKLLIDVRNQILNQRMREFNQLMISKDKIPQSAFLTEVKMDFSRYPFKFIKHEGGFITFDSFSFNFLQSITQNRLEFDRADSADFALVVENYITNQRNFASKKKGENSVNLSDPIQPSVESEQGNALENGSVMKVSLDHFVIQTIMPTTKITKTKSLTVILPPTSKPSH